MLPKEENEILCRVGPGTPMGDLLRQFWFPAMPSYELPSPDCPPIKVRVRAYPAPDINHMIWVYMGPREVPPPFPKFEVTTLPPEQVNEPMIMMEEANWFQNLEGDIDSSHIDYLHSRLRNDVKLDGN